MIRDSQHSQSSQHSQPSQDSADFTDSSPSGGGAQWGGEVRRGLSFSDIFPTFPFFAYAFMIIIIFLHSKHFNYKNTKS